MILNLIYKKKGERKMYKFKKERVCKLDDRIFIIIKEQQERIFLKIKF